VKWAGENKSSLSALHLATLNDHTDVVHELIQAKCDVNAKDGYTNYSCPELGYEIIVMGAIVFLIGEEIRFFTG
jgi:hypothetical protein